MDGLTALWTMPVWAIMLGVTAIIAIMCIGIVLVVWTQRAENAAANLTKHAPYIVRGWVQAEMLAGFIPDVMRKGVMHEWMQERLDTEPPGLWDEPLGWSLQVTESIDGAVTWPTSWDGFVDEDFILDWDEPGFYDYEIMVHECRWENVDGIYATDHNGCIVAIAFERQGRFGRNITQLIPVGETDVYAMMRKLRDMGVLDACRTY